MKSFVSLLIIVSVMSAFSETAPWDQRVITPQRVSEYPSYIMEELILRERFL